MALVLADRVKETTTSVGTGTVTLAGAATGFQAFSVIGNGNTTYYCIAGQGTSEWEVGIGTYTASGTTLSRDTVLASSAGAPNKTSFSSGTKDVFVTYTAARSVNVDGSTIDTFGMGAVQGDLLYASAANTFSRLAKDANASRYLSNSGSSNNPAWAQVNLANGVTGTLPVANGGTGQTTALIPSGTAMMFVQSTAPTGWTKSTAHDNKALRVVSGTASSGGTVAFTTAFASQAVSGTNSSTTATNQNTTATGTVGATTLSTAQIPSHDHTYLTAGNKFGFPDGPGDTGPTYRYWRSGDIAVNTGLTGGGGSHDHTFTGTAHTHTQDGHTHTFTGTAINLAVQYVDVIIATKN